MNCKQIQELILTDYSDDELSQALRKEVRAHVMACSECRQFEQRVQKTTIEPFSMTDKIAPPDYIWDRIKEKIALENKQQPAMVFSGLRNFFHRIFIIPRPVFAVATIMVVILITVVLMRSPYQRQDTVALHLEEQIEFLSSLDVDEISDASLGFGTAIEEYLL